ncbi:hypothetical protein [Streptomyces sp. NPDC001970]
MPARAGLALRAGDLPAVEVDVEVVAAEAVVLAVLAGGVDRQRSGERDLVFAGCLFQMDQGGVAAVDPMLGGQQPAALQPGVDAGQSLSVVAGGVGGDHICDHVDAVRITGLGEMCDEPFSNE